jgi:hypothetical protein
VNTEYGGGSVSTAGTGCFSASASSSASSSESRFFSESEPLFVSSGEELMMMVKMLASSSFAKFREIKDKRLGFYKRITSRK